MTTTQSTNYYIIRNSELVNITNLLSKKVVEDVLDELSDLAEPTPGDEGYANVYGKSVSKKRFSSFIEPKLEDTLTQHSEDTGQHIVTIYQWSFPDLTLYFLLKGRNMVGLEYILGSIESEKFEAIVGELVSLFEDIENNAEPSYVRTISFNRDDINKEARYSEPLMDMVNRELLDSGEHSLQIYEWTE